MRHRRNAAFVIALIPLASLAFSTRLPAQERPGDKGEAPEEQKLKGRTSVHVRRGGGGAVTLDSWGRRCA